MSHQLPIVFCLFTSTKGHWGTRDLYKATLDHWDRQIPLSLFGERIAHIKVSSNDEAIGATIQGDLESRGFHVIITHADWSRGQSHQLGYMGDVVRVSKERRVYSQPYMLWAEDDSICVSHEDSLADLWLKSIRMLEEDHELVSVRLLRKCDEDGTLVVPEAARNPRWFHCPHFNVQPLLLRSRDFYLVGRALEGNPTAVAQVQCEMLLRLILESFSRSDCRHRVYRTTYAETVHLGVPQYADLLREHRLA